MTGSVNRPHDQAEAVSKAVERTQSEIDRLIAALARGENPPEPHFLPLETDEPEKPAKPKTAQEAEQPRDAERVQEPEKAHVPEKTQERRPRRSGGPLYLILSSKEALSRKYGNEGFEALDADLHDLKRAVERHGDLEVVIAYVDDASCLSPFGLQPLDKINPWRVKNLVDSLDARATEENRQIRYLLIVGGDGVIPFHRVSNPVEDQDSDVPSDNPYACRNGNYLAPERAIGRLPDGEGQGVEYLRTLIQNAVEAQEKHYVSKGLWTSLNAALQKFRHPSVNGSGLGYSASIWRKASRAVFNLIGNDSSLRTSPPLTYEGFQVLDPPHFSYFNLHGIEDGPNWYGQRDALFPADYPLFPLALRPQDPSIREHRNAVVFTEACYGANILGKTEEDSIALRLMAAGALAVVGSTKVSYGSIAPPLLGADLIGKYFWEGLRDRLTIGEALQHAKLTMANEMHKSQGYLDDEDQKALISFVLYGDPSLSVTAVRGAQPARVSSESFCPPIICSRKPDAQKALASEELVAQVKARIEATLPYMSQASVRAKALTLSADGCAAACGLSAGQSAGPSQQAGADKGLSPDGLGWTFTLRKDIAVGGDGAHHQIVKVVVDPRGHIRRMVLSK